MIKLSKEEIDAMPEFMPVVGYEGLYVVGKNGSVWSLNYNHTGQRKELRPASYNKYGHLQVVLCKNGKKKSYRVHQLVLNAYLPKPSEDLEVLHQNSEPSDNRLENLAWGTHEENMNDPHHLALQTNRSDLSIPIVCFETGTEYPSVREASRQTGVNLVSISYCLNDKCKTAGGFHWQKLKES